MKLPDFETPERTAAATLSTASRLAAENAQMRIEQEKMVSYIADLHNTIRELREPAPEDGAVEQPNAPKPRRSRRKAAGG